MRLRRFSIFDENLPEEPLARYFDNEKNKEIFNRVADKCYIPTNALLLELIDRYGSRFKLSFSLTGTFLEQAALYRPDVLESFRALSETGCVDFLNETYYHSLSSLFQDKTEFLEQVRMHSAELKRLFGIEADVFRNTEALFSNEIAKFVEDLGYLGIIGEGHERVLGWRSPNYVYSVKGCRRIKALLRNYRLSDDISYRFSATWWSEYPLTADKYARWLSATPGRCINIFMDYETFGEHQWKETGIFEFLRHLPGEVLRYEHLEFRTPNEVIREQEPVGEIDVPYLLSWADIERDASAWLGNQMQRACFNYLQRLEKEVREAGDAELLHVWRLLQNSDHLYYLCTKSWADGDVHKYFSPFPTPYDAFINYMNILHDFKHRLERL